MEVNKEEAERCIELGEKYIKNRNKEKAEKFLQKAERLYPTQKAKDLLIQVALLAPGKEREERKQPASPKHEKPAEPEYTPEQQAAVKRIKGSKDYYEILGVNKDATDSDIKKAYKKLALQLHPDKNKAPGAGESFKAIGNAVSVLTDTVKRKQYDMFGPENEHSARTHRHSNHATYTRGFESDATAEELFNMFFGSGFTSGANVFVRRNARMYRQNASHESHTHQRDHQENNSYAAFFQLLPILLAILLSMFSSFFISDPAYSLQATTKYNVPRVTHNLGVQYFVKDTFSVEYQGSIRRLELSIEEEYLTNLRHACYREKSYRDSMLWKAKNFGNRDLYQSAQNLKMPSCERLNTFRQQQPHMEL